MQRYNAGNLLDYSLVGVFILLSMFRTLLSAKLFSIKISFRTALSISFLVFCVNIVAGVVFSPVGVLVALGGKLNMAAITIIVVLVSVVMLPGLFVEKYRLNRLGVEIKSSRHIAQLGYIYSVGLALLLTYSMYIVAMKYF